MALDSEHKHLTDHNVKLDRHKSVEGQEPAPIGYPSPEEAQKELETLELKRSQRGTLHNAKRETLRSRFLTLSDDVKTAIKRGTNQNLLEGFFARLDQGLPPSRALQMV